MFKNKSNMKECTLVLHLAPRSRCVTTCKPHFYFLSLDFHTEVNKIWNAKHIAFISDTESMKKVLSEDIGYERWVA